MKYVEFPVRPELSEYVQLAWAMESETEDDVFPREQILPDGIVELIFHYGDPFYTYQDGKKFLQPESFAISMMRQSVEIESAGRTGFVSIRCFPWGGHHFFDEPVQNFLDRTIPAEALWGTAHEPLMQALRSGGSLEEKAGLVQTFLCEQLDKHKKPDPLLDKAIRLVRRSKGVLGIEEVAATTGYSKKQLERKFLSSVGTTPKIFSRISRFLAICHDLEANSHASLTELAYDCGFYDQAHFIKEFKAFSGFTPKEFFARKNVVFSEL